MPTTPTTLISLNGHPTQILSGDTPVKVVSKGGREVLVFTGQNIQDWVIYTLPVTELPIPKVGNSEEQERILTLQGGLEIPVKISSGNKISDLPEQKEGVIYITSFPTAKAAAEQGRNDFACPGKVVMEDNDTTTRILGCLGLVMFQ